MKKRIVISLGIDDEGSRRYRNALGKLRRSVLDYHIGEMKFYTEYPEGCPTHQEINYGFKPFVINIARVQGYEQVLWIDAGCVVTKRLDAIWDIIDEQGYYLQQNGWNTGNWMTDKSLEIMNLTRDEAMDLPHAMANVMGFDFTTSICQDFFYTWYEYSKNKEVFSGPWKNDRRQCSADERCLGHRHDQSIASVIASKLEMKFTDTSKNKLLTYGPPDTKGYVLVASGV
ncbi:MAG: hypothetical protein KOO65_08650 [Desulfobacterales bacterium]|nr:hypothetical protein [Desulfobacterales bacterium]